MWGKCFMDGLKALTLCDKQISTISRSRDSGFRFLVIKQRAWAMGVRINPQERIKPQGANQCGRKGPDLFSQDERTEPGVVKASSAQLDPQMSRQVPSHQMSPLGPQLQDIQGVKTQLCTVHERQVFVYTWGTPLWASLLFSGIQHFRHSSLDLKGV